MPAIDIMITKKGIVGTSHEETSVLLQENGDFLLQEDGISRIKLEDSP